MVNSVELKTRQIVGEENGPHLLITGGVHGDEFEPMAAIRRLMTLLKPSEMRGQVTLVPVVNEAAYLHGHRMADDELDLARVCPGRPNGSITELTAHALSNLIRTADYYIDLHTGGTTLSVLPLSGYSLHKDSRVLDQQRRMARAFNLPIVWGTPCNSGRSLSVAHDAGIPAIYAEYLGGARCDTAGIMAYVEGCLNVMAELKILDRDIPASMVEYVVEDNKPGAGHMQIQNPSPMTGFFESKVGLGDTIEVGDQLGTVCSVLGESQEVICSQQKGIVLVLKTFSRVLKGESVGVVLETNKTVELEL